MPDQDNFDFDDFKKTWQQQEVSGGYQQSEIEAMLNKKSKNYVKYILWISIAEFLIFGFLNFVAFFSDNFHSDFTNILNKLRIRNQSEVEFSLDKIYMWMKILSLVITGIFVLRFYSSYKKINIESNLKKFIEQIISFKNTVNLFIFINIFLLILFVGGFTGFLIFTINRQNINIDNPTLMGLVTGVVFGLLISVILILIYYKIAYGILLKRLSRNLTQLEKIDSEKS